MKLLSSPLVSFKSDMKLAGELFFNEKSARLTFKVSGEIPQRPSLLSPPMRQTGLWQRDCIELFLLKENGAYEEWNFSLEKEWDCFEFSSYRSPVNTGLQAPFGLSQKKFHLSDSEVVSFNETGKNTFLCELPYQLKQLQEMKVTAVQMSAIFYDSENAPTYFALEHGEKPDFHRLQNFKPILI